VTQLLLKQSQKQRKLLRARDPMEYYNQCTDGKQRCYNILNSTRFYTAVAERGLNYGPFFQSLRNIRYNNTGETVGVTSLRNWVSHTKDFNIQSHIIHPTALDTFFQLTFAALTDGGKDSRLPTMVPVLFRKFWIAALEPSDESDKDAEALIYTKSKLQGFKSCETSIIAVDAKSKLPLVLADMELTSVGSSEASDVNTTPKRLCYGTDWKPDLETSDAKELILYCSRTSAFAPLVPDLLTDENGMSLSAPYGSVYFSAQMKTS
jgi:hypothetical protein